MRVRMTKTLTLAMFLLAACGGSKPAATTTPAPAEAAPAPAAAAAPAPAADGKLTQAQCSEALDHAITIMEADEKAKAYAPKMHEAHDQLVSDCAEKGTKKDYDCLMAAKTFAELGGCEEPQQ
jgi:hypothetical protein